MLDLSILTPTHNFPDQGVNDSIVELGGRLVAHKDTHGFQYVFPPLGTQVHYLNEPELDIPCVLLQGPEHWRVAQELSDLIDCVSPIDAAISYVDDTTDEVKVTLLRILCAHALQGISDPMASAALKAAQDPSPYVRIGVVQLAQYANHDRIDAIVAELLRADEEPNVREFATSVLENNARIREEQGLLHRGS